VKDKAFIGAWVPTTLKERVKTIARSQRRSLNAQLEIFLLKGVTHHKQNERKIKQALESEESNG
jgi:hypothetical protein